MKKLFLTLFALALCLMATTAFAADVPMSTRDIPGMQYMPATPDFVRVKNVDGTLTMTLEGSLPGGCELAVLAVGPDARKTAVIPTRDADGNYVARLPQGCQWTEIRVTWAGNINAVARYSMAGRLTRGTRYAGSGNEYVFDGSGRFIGFGYGGGVHVQFDRDGLTTAYGYEAMSNTLVWFNLRGEVIRASYDDGVMAAEWAPGTGWYVSTPNGVISVHMNVNPYDAAPLLPPDPDAEYKEPEVIWYTSNTITLAGLRLQEADASLPDKWYNMVPVDLTVQGRQVYDLVITDANFIGKCYVDVAGDEVTVSYDLFLQLGIDVKTHYGRWFVRLGDITKSSIEAVDEPIPFGEPMSISEDLGGADVAMLFIRSKATYRQPFADGSMLSAYFRNKPDWKAFREELKLLVPRID